MNGKRVLIVDDEQWLLEKMENSARSLGVEVDTETDGELAWKRLENCRYDLLVTDLRMPQMSGHQLMEKVAALQRPPAVIVVTGHPSLGDAIACMKNGAKDFLQKPFSGADFTEVIKRQLTAQAKSEITEIDWMKVSDNFQLTPAQLRIVQAVYRTGNPTEKLAKELNLSPHTVRSHLQVVFQKADVKSRIALLQKIRHYADVRR